MSEFFKSAAQAGYEARSRGQTGIKPEEPGSLGFFADAAKAGFDAAASFTPPAKPKRTALAQPATAEDGSPIDPIAEAYRASYQSTQEVAPAPQQDVGLGSSLSKGFKSVMVTWDFLANKLEQAVTGDDSTTAPILQKGVEEYKAMASDPRIQELIQKGNDAPDYYTAGKEMLGYVLSNPGVVVNFLGEQAAPMVASIPLGGVGGKVAQTAVARTALSAGTKAAVTMGATGASLNASAVVLGSLGTNYVEGLDKFNGDTEAAKDYAATKTLAEVPANAVAGMFLGVNPFTRLAAKTPTGAAVGNVLTQTAIQGAGGGVGAYQAATSVGEEAGKGEILAEIFGEGLMAPVDIYTARREAQAGQPKPEVTPPATPATPTSPTEPSAPSGEVVSKLGISDDEFRSAINSPAFMAAAYARGDDSSKASLQRANPNLNLPGLAEDANLVMDGMRLLDALPQDFGRAFGERLSTYEAPAPTAQTQATQNVAPFEGGTVVDQNAPGDFIPVREKMRMAQEAAQEGQMIAEGKIIAKERDEAVNAQKDNSKSAVATGEENTPIAQQPSPLSQLSQAEQQIRQTAADVSDGEKVTVAWVNAGETSAQVKTGTVNSRGNMKWVEWEEGILPNGKPTKQRIFLDSDSSAVINPTTQDVEALEAKATEEAVAAAKAQRAKKQSQAAPSAQAQPRFGLPSTISVDDKVYVVEIGPTNKKRADNSPVHAFVSHKGRVIKIDARAIIDQFDKDPWTTPKVEGVLSLPEDTFTSAEQWLDFVFKHEVAHINNKKLPEESKGQYENRINQIALTEIKGQEYADSIYGAQGTLKPDMSVKAAFDESVKNNKNLPLKLSDKSNETIASQVQDTTPEVTTTRQAEEKPSRQEPVNQPAQEPQVKAEQVPVVPVQEVEPDDGITYKGPKQEVGPQQKPVVGTFQPPVKPTPADVKLTEKMEKEATKRQVEARKEFLASPYTDAIGIARIEDKFGTEFPVNAEPIREIVNTNGVVIGKIFKGKGKYAYSIIDPAGIDGSTNFSINQGPIEGLRLQAVKLGATVRNIGEVAPREVTPRTGFDTRVQEIISGQAPVEVKKPRAKFKKDEGLFADDTGGVMGNLARSGAMGLDALAELGIKERKSYAQRKAAEKQVTDAIASIKKRVQDLVDNIDSKLKQLSDIRKEMATKGFSFDEIEATVGSQEDALIANRDEIVQLGQEQLDDMSTRIPSEPRIDTEPEMTQDEMNEQLALEEEVKQEVSEREQQRELAKNIVDAVVKDGLDIKNALDVARKENVGAKYILDAVRNAGFEASVEAINYSGSIAFNYSLRDYVRESGYSGYIAREQWLKSLDNMPDQFKPALDETEKAAYESWKDNRRAYINRLSNEVKNKAKDNEGLVEEVFPNALFVNYSLKEMRDPNIIPEPNRSVIKDLFESPVTAWFDDIKEVLKVRPDFEQQVMDSLTADEQAEYNKYIVSEMKKLLKKSDMLTRSPAYSQLNQMRYLSPEMFEQYKTQIRMAEDNQMAVILREASEMNDRAKLAVEQGANLDETIGAQMDAVYHQDEMASKNLDEIAESDTSLDDLVKAMTDIKTRYKRGKNSGVVSALAVHEQLENIFAKSGIRPAYTVYENMQTLMAKEPETYKRLTSRFEGGSFKGALDPKTGHIYLISGNMDSMADAEFTMFHELHGHWGMRAFLGNKLDAFLENQYKLNQEVRQAADKLAKEAKDMGMPMSKLESVEEAISDIAATGDTRTFKQLIGRLVSWLKANGFTTVARWMDTKGESELAYVLSASRKAARGQGSNPTNGAPSEVRYAINKTVVEMFAVRDAKTTAYARMNPIDGSWTVFTIKDLASGDFSAMTVEDYEAALAVMNKQGKVSKATERSTRRDVSPEDFVDIPDARDVTGWRKWARYLQIKAQNVYLPIFEVAQYLNMVGRDNDVVEKLKQYEGKLGWHIKKFRKEYSEPITKLLKSIADKGGAVDDVDRFLLARHAVERNQTINKINPSNKSGSGMSTSVADKLLDTNNDGKWDAYIDDLKALGALTDKLSKSKLNYMLSQGLITESQATGIASYEHYVNLSGNEELKLDAYDSTQLGGRAFNLRGADAKRATGRGTEPVDVLENTLNSYIATLIRGQKAEVVRSVLDMVEANPDPTFAVVEEITERKVINTDRLLQDKKIMNAIGDQPNEGSGYKYLLGLQKRLQDGYIDVDQAMLELAKRINEAELRRDIEPVEADAAIRRINEEIVLSARLSPDGYVTMVEDQTVMNAKNVLVVKVGGKIKKITFKDKGLEFVNALSGMSVQQRSDTLNAIGAFNRFFGQLVTSWNPAWVPVNGIRDFETALSNMASDPRVGAKLANEMRKKWAESYRTAFRLQVADFADTKTGWWGKMLNNRKQKYPISQSEADLFDRFSKNGGETFFLDRKGVEASLDSMNRAMFGPKGALEFTQDKLQGIGDFMELMTLPMETAPRFAVFKTLVEAGWSDVDAAIYAKELTVNFNMKGSSELLRNLFVFANPSIQGTYRLFQDYSRSDKGVGKYLPSNRFAAVASAWMFMGIVANFIARGLGGEDDENEGVDKLDQVPHHKRSTSMVLIPDVPGMAIPLGYGYNFFYTAGNYMADVWLGKKTVEQAAGKVMATGFDAFAPVGSGSDNKAVALLPTPAVPVVEYYMNKNRFGAPIYKEQNGRGVDMANSWNHFDSANPLSTSLFHSLNEATGGTRYKSGLIDVNPAAVDHFLTSYMPGLITEAYRATGTGIRMARGEDTKSLPLPLVDRLTAKVPEGWDAGAIRRVEAAVNTAHKEYTSIDTTPERRKEIIKEHPSLFAAKAVISGSDQQIRQLRSTLREIELDPRRSDAEKVAFRNKLKAQEKAIQAKAINAAINAGFSNEAIND